MLYLISYDIHLNKKRRKIAKILEGYGLRVQYSFFQCDLPKEIMENLEQEIVELINEDEDSFYICPICVDCSTKAEIDGTGNIVVVKPFEII